ncbi:MAG TPA: superoxide dismutase [Cu-Zn] SodC [Syntrophales bacterium]|nr:superoxide dismutase [Cu-Zn] SodC [Syntrophales bacterium]
MRKIILVFLGVIFITGYALAEEKEIQMYLVNDQGIGKNIGEVTATDSQYGLILMPQLRDLPPGIHGFHVHQNPDCNHAMKDGKHVAALAAGGHLDPLKTGKHEGPYGEGHLGDLPVLYADTGGKATVPVLAPRLKVADLKGKSLMIHAGGDNYSDTPEALGGGGARIACGVIK